MTSMIRTFASRVARALLVGAAAAAMLTSIAPASGAAAADLPWCTDPRAYIDYIPFVPCKPIPPKPQGGVILGYIGSPCFYDEGFWCSLAVRPVTVPVVIVKPLHYHHHHNHHHHRLSM